MDVFDLFPVLIVLIGVLAVGRLIQFYSLPTFEGYKQQHPEAVGGRGGVRCCHCGSSYIHIWWLWGPQWGGPKKHLCRSCGNALYRS